MHLSGKKVPDGMVSMVRWYYWVLFFGYWGAFESIGEHFGGSWEKIRVLGKFHIVSVSMHRGITCFCEYA